jgi:hypothetical protein
MFLFRLIMAVALIAFLIPLGRDPDGASGAQVSPLDALAAAGATIEDMRGFCDRQPAACEVGSHTLQAVGETARASAQTIQELIARTAAEPLPPLPAARSAEAAEPPAPPAAPREAPASANLVQSLLHRLGQATFSSSASVAATPTPPLPEEMASSGTLQAADMAPAWRAPKTAQ